MTTHKSGFVNIIGLPNVGKSTLLNAILGEKLSIITKKAQTTRHRIHGILSDENYQIVFSDTPGFIEKPAYKMQEEMNKYVKSTFEDADIFLFLVELGSNPEKQIEIYQALQNAKVPVIVLINKIDKAKDEEEIKKYAELWNSLLPNSEILYISALEKFNLDAIKNSIIEQLPEGPVYYDKDMLSDKNERFFVTEIIRGKLLEQYKQEIPYSCQVEIDEFIEDEFLDKIRATIYTERDTQKSIIIGKGGDAIKKLGTSSRIEIESFLGKKVYLELFVKVKENWRNDDMMLRHFGYKE
ncbi:MAG: GTPase Era [Chitinophagales bacterium]|nr:GTPase Era [Chitinophagales bacterium]